MEADNQTAAAVFTQGLGRAVPGPGMRPASKETHIK